MTVQNKEPGSAERLIEAAERMSIVFKNHGHPEGLDYCARCALVEEVESAIAALRAAHQAPQAEPWQPIETAPRDGTIVLGWPIYGHAGPREIYWSGKWDKKGWVATNASLSLQAPMLWMPLPLPPDSLPCSNCGRPTDARTRGHWDPKDKVFTCGAQNATESPMTTTDAPNATDAQTETAVGSVAAVGAQAAEQPPKDEKPFRGSLPDGVQPPGGHPADAAGFLQRLNDGDLHSYLHLIWARCWWLFDTAAPMKNRVGAQSVISELSHYAKRLNATSSKMTTAHAPNATEAQTETALAAVGAAEQVEHDGWKLVPARVTAEMRAAFKEWWDTPVGDLESLWRVLLRVAARPQPPLPQAEKE